MKSPRSLLRKTRSILFTAFAVLVIAATRVAGSNASPGIEDWRPVGPAELALKKPMVDPDADAEAIFWDIRVDDGGESDLVLSHYIRIKISLTAVASWRARSISRFSAAPESRMLPRAPSNPTVRLLSWAKMRSSRKLS